MLKIITTLLLFTLLFTACAERGSTLTPKRIETKPMQIKAVASSIKMKFSSLTKKQKSKKDIIPPKSNVAAIPKVETKILHAPFKEKSSSEVKSLFSLHLNDDTKNKISGFFIFVIGVMIFI